MNFLCSHLNLKTACFLFAVNFFGVIGFYFAFASLVDLTWLYSELVAEVPSKSALVQTLSDKPLVFHAMKFGFIKIALFLLEFIWVGMVMFAVSNVLQITLQAKDFFKILCVGLFPIFIFNLVYVISMLTMDIPFRLTESQIRFFSLNELFFKFPPNQKLENLYVYLDISIIPSVVMTTFLFHSYSKKPLAVSTFIVVVAFASFVAGQVGWLN